MEISSERLAYWYFRLNGFFGNDNFIIHEAQANPNHATEIDYIGVRFKHRKELYDARTGEYMKDDEQSALFRTYKYSKKKVFICLAEVKSGVARLNSAQTDKNKPNAMLQTLLSLGLVACHNVDGVVKRLQKYGFCNTYWYHISFVAIGERNENSRENIPFEKVPVITWDEVKNFIYNRFHDNRPVKANLKEWERMEAKELGDLANRVTIDEFKRNVNIT
jgi:hypothetical protein